jgi:DNA-binding GntR family transcriptional regulator
MSKTAYNVVAARLRQEILTGKRAPAERLPGERDLCAEFNVSRITIRHALRLLVEEGLLQHRNRSGNYVAPHPARRIPVMIDYTGSMRDHAPQLQRQLLRSAWLPATELQAAALRLAPGDPVLCAERLDLLDEHPVAWDRAVIARKFAEKLTEADLGRVDFLERWMKRGRFQVVNCQQTIEAAPAETATALLLLLPASDNLLRSTETYFAAADEPAGWFVSAYHPRFICIRSQFRWGRKTP